MVFFSFGKALDKSLFHITSPAGSDSCSLFFIGNVYSFEIFSIGSSTRTKAKKEMRGA